MCICMQKTWHTHGKDSVDGSPCQSLVDYGNISITQHALKVSAFRVLKLDTIPWLTGFSLLVGCVKSRTVRFAFVIQ